MKIDEINAKKVLWWGRSDVSYSRNGVIRNIMRQIGMNLTDFKPKFTFAGHIEAAFYSKCNADIVWVPCFRQRDVLSASKWASRKNIPLIFDPLISAYDKQVFERKKFLPESAESKRLFAWESKLFQRADILIADTWLHAQYFEDVFKVQHDKIHVVPVSAEEHLFNPMGKKDVRESSNCTILFYGNFLELHGVDTICEAIRRNNDESIAWLLVGDGPMKPSALEKCKGIPNVTFVGWENCAYEELPKFIHNANLVLGIFGSGDKAKRVIPNKVYQAIACGRPVVTMRSDAYPKELFLSTTSGFHWVEPENPDSILKAVDRAIAGNLQEDGEAAYQSYCQYFSMDKVKSSLLKIFQQIC